MLHQSNQQMNLFNSELIAESYCDVTEAMQLITKCIMVYNFRRVHSSINYEIPHHVHIQKTVKKL